MLLYSNLPALPMAGLRREMDRLFEDVFGTLGNGRATAAWTPVVDVREDDRGFTFEIEIPGVEPAKVEVTATNGVLTVRGDNSVERTSESATEAGDRWHVIERRRGTFSRSFQLPSSADESAIEATFAHGVLTVRVPKLAQAAPRRIEVRTR